MITQPGAATSYLIVRVIISSYLISFFMSSFRRRSARYVARPKRNAERHIRAGTIPMLDPEITYTGYVYTAGSAQTVRSIKLDLGLFTGTDNQANKGCSYALVVVREGYQANALNYPALTTDMYNPTMDVLISGVVTDESVEDHKFNNIGRKLKTGDRICLIVRSISGTALCTFELSFSVLT